MNNINFSTDDGKVLLDDAIVAPLSLSNFRIIAEERKIKYGEYQPSAGWITIAMDVNILSDKFGMNISYNENNLMACWFGWDAGISSLKGYETSEKELIADKNSLSKIISKKLCKNPEEKNYNNDVFLYEWGYISTVASIKSTSVAVGIGWKKCDEISSKM
jgi:hypothetical protein